MVIKSTKLFWGILFALLTACFSFYFYITYHHRHWQDQEPYRLLVVKQNRSNSTLSSVNLISIWPNTHKTTEIIFPPQLIISAVGGYGKYRLDAFIKLGDVEKVGSRLLADSLSVALGIPIHQVITGSRLNDLLTAQWYHLVNSVSNKRSLVETVQIALLLNQAKNKTQFDLIANNLVQEQIEIDQTSGMYLKIDLLEKFVLENLSAVWPRATKVQVAIVNASGKPGQAAFWSRFLRNNGFDVVSVTDQPIHQYQTKIIFSTPQLYRSIMADSLTNLLPLNVREVGDTNEYRADVAILLGDDLWQYLNERNAYLKSYR